MELGSGLMVPLINSVGCIKGEIHNIVTIMRLTTRWANAARFTREVLNKVCVQYITSCLLTLLLALHLRLCTQDASDVLHSFRTLHEQLEGVYDIREVDCVLYLQPFVSVVSSQSTR
jgi:hypothetical protein